ncbi:ribonuclease Y-like [Epinephelus fuscoguttatus]|uniref:ribonuclease Y-like n=1 Tax=Epinephelus fuscoguttatus TaxID=293821 RepID=UPI0020D03101|nr:ribonuclease Y-like [Epinephelus fuscoguttatus]
MHPPTDHLSAASSADDMPTNMSQTIFTSDCAPMAAVCSLVALAIGGLIVAVVICKWRSDKADLQRKITSLQNERDRDEEENIAQVLSSLQGLIRDLEAQKHQVKGELQRVEAEREENERQLQSVEAEITEREKLFDKPEGLLRDKEKLLQAQWKLDETKRNIERRMLNIEKVLEPVEIQVSRMNKKRCDQFWLD